MKVNIVVILVSVVVVFIIVTAIPVRSEPGWVACSREDRSFFNDCSEIRTSFKYVCPDGWTFMYDMEQTWNVFGWENGGPANCM